MANEVKGYKTSAMMLATTDVLAKLNTFEKENSLTYTEYGRTCVNNLFSKLNDLLLDSKLDWGHFNSNAGINNLFSLAKFVMSFELNVLNNEVAISFRKKDVDGIKVPMLDYRIQGSGNDVVLRKFGNNVLEVRSYIVYEDDEFTMPYMDGFNFVLPTHRPKFKNQKPIYAVYLIKLKNGSVDVTIGTREDVKISLLAHIEDSNRFDRKYTKELKKELENLTLDELIEKYSDFPMTDGFLIKNKAYTSANRERMIERKMRNWALRKYSHNLNFEKKAFADMYVETFDEEDRFDKKSAIEVIQHNEIEFEEKNSKTEIVEENFGKDVGLEVVEVVEEEKETIEEQEKKPSDDLDFLNF